jgi:hypothetical protein
MPLLPYIGGVGGALELFHHLTDSRAVVHCLPHRDVGVQVSILLTLGSTAFIGLGVLLMPFLYLHSTLHSFCACACSFYHSSMMHSAFSDVSDLC